MILVRVSGTECSIDIIAYDVIWPAAIVTYAPGALARAHGHEYNGGIFNTNGKVVFAEMVFDGGDVVRITEGFVMFDDVVQFGKLLDGGFAGMADEEHEAEGGAAALGE